MPWSFVDGRLWWVNGTALKERDWLVTVARPDGDLNYMVFVSPERDFAMLKPLFSSMVMSFKAQ